jgi:transposase InsO family protein
VLEDKAMKVHDTEQRLLVKAILSKNRIFKVELGVLMQQCLATAVDKEEWLWHFRYGHLNFGDLNRMQSKAIVKGLPHIHVPKDVCAECVESKMPRGAFNPNVPSRSKRKLQVIFSDVCGPIQHETPAGNKYFITFIDEFTRKLWIYLIRRKNDVLGIFKKFKVLVEKQCGQNIEILRTDGGGEYVSTEFNEYCENEGITHEVTPPYTPQHNGVAERKNRTLLNMVRSMLKSKNMPKTWWGEAVNTAAYIINRSPTKKMENVTPEEAWTGVKPNVSHFRVFGSVCYRHVPDQLRTKLDDKGELMIMVGYHSTGGYKLVNPVNNKIVISRDVVFDEGKTWKWSDRGESSTSVEQNLFDVPAGETELDLEVEIEGVEENEGEGGSPDIPRRPLRQKQVPARLNDCEIMSDGAINDEGDIVHFALLAETEPVTLEEAMKNPKWLEAMKEEIRSIEKNLTWELVELPKGKKAIGVKWVYKVKFNPKGEVVKYKARLVARGFLQRHGVDYEEVFAPVARLETVRVVVAHASMQRWKIHQLDVKSAFLNGELEEEVYVEQPAGFVKQGSENKVLKLRKALYGLKQAPRAWNKKIDKSLINMGYLRCISEHGVYVKSGGGDVVILCLYVDDLLVTGNNEAKVTEFKKKMMNIFEMTDLGEISYFLGIEFQSTSDGVLLSQKKYASDILKRFNLQHCNSAQTPAEARLWLDKDADEPEVDATEFRQMVGALRYLCNTRPDIAFSVGLISRVMDRPRTSHLAAAKRILRYVKGTMTYGILLPSKCRENEKGLYGFTDADWGGDKTDRKSTAGSVFLLGTGPISWSSKKESAVALSSCEAEYIAASMGACQAIWLDNLMQELMIKKEGVVELFMDNKSAISLAKHPVAHGRSKHIETRYHFLRDQVTKGRLKLSYCRSDMQLADIFTKAVKTETFKKLRNLLNVVDCNEFI